MTTEAPRSGTDHVVDMPEPNVREHPAHDVSGLFALVLSLAGSLICLGAAVVGIVVAASGHPAPGVVLIVVGLLGLIASIVALCGLTAVAPGEARVVALFGRYTGTIRTTGLRWVNPFTTRHKVSTRIRNHESGVAKVNDADGNPIEISAVVVWQVEDTAQAVFEVDDFVEFVAIQSETAVRHIATSYPYDAAPEIMSLRDNAEEITAKLSGEIAARVASAGVQVIESRITRLAYAPEIAQAMLRRQQAGAVVAARSRIVEGAVGMVEAALTRLDQENIIDLDDERKASMVSNLLVVLCSEQSTQPVINAGSLYT
ncbi:Regulator of protease activity HflC, stomatin/prohibitin superfamily [Parafrankia irregularis]|uniref:Regulator of protease activity HflC, stomatin/prohibitin superfamily n=1 Tax=Parafrankia irregularis TaxID=795642 RepID=A0A0S4QUV6_9ACTN|nr:MULTISPECIES: SPFH domain-containing protein [Parafrankia]MBE3201564.1 SPFH domain-containing protein [Parafrankia sp. CH37]CUU59361.1 Regulator of protease activity HflC, stomatin/prohibitin superfamily [Parafrankia irregularis]